MTETQKRRNAIRRLIAESIVETQNDLVERLLKAGIPATQSSVSRDIRHLGLVKIGGRYELPRENGATSFPVEIQSAEPADAVAVLRVSPGQASLLGIRLDQLGWPEIVGTVAGDDTLLIACRDRTARNLVLARLSAGLHSNEKG